VVGIVSHDQGGFLFLLGSALMDVRALDGCALAPVAPSWRLKKARRHHVTAGTPRHLNVSSYGIETSL
jgi:hypothetical protein